MTRYRIQFTKHLCNDIGEHRNCVQAVIDVRRAKTEARAVQAAQKRFERQRRIPHWEHGADAFEITQIAAQR
ncbi:MAG TPA: hypothetical protein VFP60_06320 [Pseudolabrys sp.]|nr:hypothetical protein [Pseudolabrys sp.]